MSPSLMLRGISAPVMARVRTFASDNNLPVMEAANRLLEVGLDASEARLRGGRNRSASITPERRADIARRAAQARWEKPSEADDDSEG